LAANDEFFAAKENLIRPTEPRFDVGDFYVRGKVMDGGETRRRREPGHDWCVIRLGLPGRVRHVVVDTRFFRGNYPEHCALEGACLPGYPSAAGVLADDVEWFPLLGRSPLKGDGPNPFDVDVPWRCTHLRLRIFPDGGVARLRVYGDVLPEWARLGTVTDLASVAAGGRVAAVSDDFYSVGGNLLQPGQAPHMGDGWETRRRRDDGHDWCVVRLGAAGTVQRVVVDTRHFRGNCPGACVIEGCKVGGDLPSDLDSLDWRPLLARTPLQPHGVHAFVTELADAGVIDHARVHIFPDGGMSRLRLEGTIDADARDRAGLAGFNALPPRAATAALKDCCGATRWAEQMAAARPFESPDALLEATDRIWSALAPEDWLEAFAAHPRIGGRKGHQSARGASWSRSEQSGMASAEDDIRRRLAAGNAAYFERFGYTFIICASGRSAAEMLENLESRLGNEPERELSAAAEQQRLITRLRLSRMVRT